MRAPRTPTIREDDIPTVRSTLARLSVAVLGVFAVAGAAPMATAHPSVETSEPGTGHAAAALIAQAQARTDSANARGRSAFAASVHTDEPGTAPSGPAEDIQFRPSLPAAGKAALTAARSATAALTAVLELPQPPKNVQLTAAAAKRAADESAAAPTDIALANLAATAENKALAASAAAFGTTATWIEWIAPS
ncbi:hypothetical protein [Nocardia sp. NPDC050175]|uniref:hypothetical protein n=1 Tax=Nocardia sp. NPDC050175 TaxID=3364317 RepID=UPI0037A455BF